MWSIWTMSGICLAAVKKHKWPTEEVLEDTLEDKKAHSFFSQTKELLFTVLVSIFILILFTNWEASRMDQFLSGLRLEILHTLRLEKSAVPTGNAISETTQITVPVQQKTIEVTPAENKKDRIESGDWAAQVIAVKTQKQAKIYKEQLVAAGFPTDTIPAHVSGTDWIRVHTGFFKSEGEARAVGEKIQQTVSILKGPYWITKVSAEEKGNLLGN